MRPKFIEVTFDGTWQTLSDLGLPDYWARIEIENTNATDVEIRTDGSSSRVLSLGDKYYLDAVEAGDPVENNAMELKGGAADTLVVEYLLYDRQL